MRAGRRRKGRSTKGKPKGTRQPYTLDDDRALIRWCLTHGDSRPSFERAATEEICSGGARGMESMRTRCRNYAMKNAPLVEEVKHAMKKEAAPSSRKRRQAADEPLTQAPDDDDDEEEEEAEEGFGSDDDLCAPHPRPCPGSAQA